MLSGPKPSHEHGYHLLPPEPCFRYILKAPYYICWMHAKTTLKISMPEISGGSQTSPWKHLSVEHRWPDLHPKVMDMLPGGHQGTSGDLFTFTQDILQAWCPVRRLLGEDKYWWEISAPKFIFQRSEANLVIYSLSFWSQHMFHIR